MLSEHSSCSIETPAIVVDLERLSKNLERVQGIGDQHGLAVRPHIKTHKCEEIASLQLEAGAKGVTASKTSEALVFVEAGAPSLTVAYPVIDPSKARRVVEVAAERGCDLRFIADSGPVAEALEKAATHGPGPVGVYVKIDVGLGRVGLRPESERLLPLARRIETARGLDFLGLLSHAGHAYGAGTLDEIRSIAESERVQLLEAKDRLERNGQSVREVSVGSTPTVLASQDFDGVSEIRPGNYVFFDLTAVRLGVATLSNVALSVLVTVLSVNENYAIIDAGSKVLSSDRGPHGTTSTAGYGLAFRAREEIEERARETSWRVEKLSEEHGFVRLNGSALRVGDRLRVVPNHSCPVANLAAHLNVFDGSGTVRQWKVAAAGKVT